MSPPVPARLVALALVRAAAALGENAELVAKGCCPQSRAAYHALFALAVWCFRGGDRRLVRVEELPFPAFLVDLGEQWGVVFDPWAPVLGFWAGLPVDNDLIRRIANELTART